MKKFMFFLLSLLTIAGIVTLEGSSILFYMQFSAGLLVTFGVLFSTLVSFSFKEIKETFADAFSESTDSTQNNRYKKGATVAASMSRLSIYWGIIGMFIGIIYILCQVNSPEVLGRRVSMTLISALYGIMYAGILFIPMQNTLSKKLLDIEEK